MRKNAGGVLAFHASNRYLDIVGVLTAVAQSHGLQVLFRDDKAGSRPPGAEPSRWLVAARTRAALGALASDRKWQQPCPHDRAWTDDFNDLPRLFAIGMLGGPSQSSACAATVQQVL